MTDSDVQPGSEFSRTIRLDGRLYDLDVSRRVELPPVSPRLVMISHLHTQSAVELLKTSLMAVRRFTAEPHEMWVVDNNSPRENLTWLGAWPDVNLILNRTEPLPPTVTEANRLPNDCLNQLDWGSYANAVGLELAVRVIDPDSRLLMLLHMDAVPCKSGWLSFLRSKLTADPNEKRLNNRGVAAAGVRMDRVRNPEGVLHVLGFMVDFQIFRKCNLDFFPDLPDLDVGDRVTVELRKCGYQVFACSNTLWNPELINNIPLSSPWRDLHVDRSFDDEGDVFFVHLGRGVRKSCGEHTKGTDVQQWIRVVLSNLYA